METVLAPQMSERHACGPVDTAAASLGGQFKPVQSKRCTTEKLSLSLKNAFSLSIPHDCSLSSSSDTMLILDTDLSCSPPSDPELPSSLESSISLESKWSQSSCTSFSSSISDGSLDTCSSRRRQLPLFDPEDHELGLPALDSPSCSPQLSPRSRANAKLCERQFIDDHPLSAPPVTKQTTPSMPVPPAATPIRPASPAQLLLRNLLGSPDPSHIAPLKLSCQRDARNFIPHNVHMDLCPTLSTVMLQTLCPDESSDVAASERGRSLGNAHSSNNRPVQSEPEDPTDWDLPNRLIAKSSCFRILVCEQEMMRLGKISQPLRVRWVHGYSRPHPRYRPPPKGSLLRNSVRV